MKEIGRLWTNQEIAQGFVGDVGSLMKIIMAKEGLRKMEDVDDRLAHELSDCLYCISILANNYGIDLEKSFLENMTKLETRISKSNE
jgi:NTP pyrophosphatase (non-canonical NTP hydrolase)